MSETAAPVITDKASFVLPFGIEADHPRNCNLKLRSLAVKPLRSAFDGNRPFEDANGRQHVPVEQMMTFAGFPRTPGQQLYVNPKACEYKVVDPLYTDQKKCDELTAALKTRNSISSNQKVGGVEPQEGKIDVHQMKTLCREMRQLVTSGEAKICRGDLPSMEEIDRMPGRYLLEPNLQMTTTRPRYEDEYEDWKARLTTNGA